MAVALFACGGGGDHGSLSDGGDGGSTRESGLSDGTSPRDGSRDSRAPTDGPSRKDGGHITPRAVCTPPIEPVDTSHPTTVVGKGTAASCTESALDAAVAKAGIVTFDCGGPATITVTKPIVLSLTTDTTLDGGGKITLDGGGTTRILYFDSLNFRATTTTVTLENITLAHGMSTGTPIPSAPPPCSQGFMLDGGGAALWMRDGVLHVIDSTFDGNTGASPGPDVGGGAIYAVGSLDVTIVGSTFTNNQASNSGAVGSLFSNLTIVNDVFSGNKATGNGENYISPMCTAEGGESGNGGNAGAVGLDGGETFTVNVCGDVFSNNEANALGGAMGRTPDGAPAATIIDRSTFDGNLAKIGGGATYFHNSLLTVTASTFSNNTAPGAGAIQSDGSTFTFTNSTFSGNTATKGLGGAILLFGNGGTLTNLTFSNNTSPAGSGYFAGAIGGGTGLTIANTIFDGNTDMDCGAPMACQDGSSTGSGDLQWPQDHVVCSNADTPCVPGIDFADAKLGALADNGGPTKTILPQKGSPAIGLGTSCPMTDQRGQPRKNTSACTAGAVEAD